MNAPIEDIFITYANNSLKENPEILYDLFEQFKHLKVYVHEEDEEAIDEIINHFVAFVKCDDLKAAKEIRKKTKPKDNRYLEVAFEGVYGYRDGYCEDKCSHRLKRMFLFEKEKLRGPERVKCYECEHLQFKGLLAAITEGAGDFDSELIPLVRYEQTAKYCLRNIEKGVIPGIPSPESFEGMSFFFHLYELFSIEGSNLRETFGKIFPGTIPGRSLIEFLKNDDRRKLKRCPGCPNFYIANRPDKRHCSRRCYNRLYHEEYMRKKRDPQSPEYDQKYKTREFG